ncbi:hypothetical protein Afil01_49480 [Actinorhabdospora filicis]|uniref:Uncharacterized protein n=1 Tax=Actinorhabdospora filicis TaxID=1785913 RepID=A0A9W6SSW1_9ACTN|nr:hypothetical protein [Actinorhabdospora filicis]GLZ80141.1 hypothetical protein Afil01_49480 [Actinorhabdospora filicis]
MPYLCEIEIAGPREGEDEGAMVTEAVLAAVEEGWRSPRVIGDDGVPVPESDEDDAVLDYRVLGYPGGAFIFVVLPDVGLESASLAAASLAHHVTTWSPGLLEYTVERLKVAPLAEPYDEENWLPPFEEPIDPPGVSIPELLGDELLAMNARYLLAGALPSLWDPTRTGAKDVLEAADLVAGASEAPWGAELVDQLGVLLIRAARLERRLGSESRLVVRGGGDLDLAEDLLRRTRAVARATGESWNEDQLRGNDLIEEFITEHELGWQHGDGDPDDPRERYSVRRLREILWAGLRALATLAAPLSDVRGVWRVLDALGDDVGVAALAEWETEELESSTERDVDEIIGASNALAAVWTAIRRPDLLPETADLVEAVVEDIAALHFFACAALLLAGGPAVLDAAEDDSVPAGHRQALREFAEALAVIDEVDDTAGDDVYERMNGALEAVLARQGEVPERVQAVLALISAAAARTSDPKDLARELVAFPTRHGIVILEDETDADLDIRLHTLAAVAEIEAVAAGEFAGDFPDLSGTDPRLEPAARERARNWVTDALALAEREAAGGLDGDAHTVVELINAGGGLPSAWPVRRVVVAAATAAARLAGDGEVYGVFVRA